MFNAPIPGESLTTAPKKYPWERPPEFVDPEDTIQFYLNKLVKADAMEGIMDAIEVGMTIKDTVEGILRMGVANGLHTVDVSLIIAPVLHEFIVGFAKELGIEYDEGFEDKAKMSKEREAKTYLKTKLRLEKQMSKGKGKMPTPRQEVKEEYTKEDLMEPETIPQEEPKGLLVRRK
jgi:hypothetical protein